MKRGVCNLCREETELAFSHIFPEFFYESTYDESHKFISVSSHPRHRPRPMQQGLREHLLCARCEGQFSRYESYAAALLREVDDAIGNVTGGAEVDGVDIAAFRLFGLSLLWRAHIARSHMFGSVDLGVHAKRIREMLSAEQPGAPHEYGFALAKVAGLATHGDMIISPMKRRYREHRAYGFMARGFEWAFVVSSGSAALTEHFPFVGTSQKLYVPTISHERAKLFAQLRRAFPEAFGRGRGHTRASA